MSNEVMPTSLEVRSERNGSRFKVQGSKYSKKRGVKSEEY